MGEPQAEQELGFAYTMAKDGVDETLMSIIMSDLRGKKARDVIERAICTLDRVEVSSHQKELKPSNRKGKQ